MKLVSKVRIAGIPTTIVGDAEAEKADMVVCCRVGMPRHFDDDVETVCSSCGHPVFHRPHAPSTPMKVCVQCAGEIFGSTKQ